MRQLKFRHWDKKEKKYFDPKDWDVDSDIDFFEAVTLEEANNPDGRWVNECYINLQDTNGKDIYENDVVKCTDEFGKETIHSIKYFSDDGYPAHDLWPHSEVESNGISHFLSHLGCSIEIIGNAHENPDVLNNG